MSPHFDQLFARYPSLLPCQTDIEAAFRILKTSFADGGQLLLAGNGGSAADADHIAGELLKGFVRPRLVDLPDDGTLDPALQKLQGGLPAIPLTGFPALRTAVANDTSPDLEFAQLVWALGRPGDVVLGISCSGNARNVLLALQAARLRGLKTMLLTGATPGKCSPHADICIRAPDTETFRIQELHLPIYHALCLALEDHFFSSEAE
ncbi:MAG: SIS domain-containing protein [Opitutaceae bacterium]